jgi:hypothetical protein
MNESEQDTTISIAISDKKRLDGLKMHRREPYKEVIHRILDDIEKISQSGVRLPSQPPQTYTSYIKALIDSKTQASQY